MVRYGDSILGIIYAVYYMQYILYIIMNTDIYGNLVFKVFQSNQIFI